MHTKHCKTTFFVVLAFAFTSCDEGDPPGQQCNNNVIEGTEVCDGTELGAETCETLGNGAGTLGCSSDCLTFDTSACGAPESCDGVERDENEVCDGDDLGGETCETQGFAPGELACADNCLSFDTTGCGASAECNGVEIDDGEICDGDNLGGETCESQGFGPGDLACADNCQSFDTSGCSCLQECGELECGPDPVCEESCGTCDDFSECQEGLCVQICDIGPIDSDRTLDLDIGHFTIDGTITVNGAQMADSLVSRGSLIFIDATSPNEEITIDLMNSGNATYSIKVFGSTYHIDLATNERNTVLPRNQRIRLESDIVIESDQSLDFDLTIHRLSGEVLVDGSTMEDHPRLSPRAALQIVEVETGHIVEETFGGTGAATFDFEILGSTYNVYLQSFKDYPETVLPSEQRVRIESDLVIDDDLERDFDVEIHSLIVELTVNGGELPESTEGWGMRGDIILVQEGEEAIMEALSLGFNSGSIFESRVFGGTFDIYIFTAGPFAQNAVPPNFLKKLETEMTIDDDVNLSYAFETYRVSGEVTINGEEMENNGISKIGNRASIVFADPESHVGPSFELGAWKGATFDTELFASNYEVLFLTESEERQDVLPGTQLVEITDDFSFDGHTTQNFDVGLHQVSGAVTVDEAQMQDDGDIDTRPRGYIHFVDTTTGYARIFNLGEQGEATFDGEILSSTYNVVLVTGTEIEQDVLIPRQTVSLEGELTISGDRSQNYNINTYNITGEVTVNGAQMPDITLGRPPRGLVTFIDVSTESVLSEEVDDSGPAAYDVDIYGGSYDIGFVTGPRQGIYEENWFVRVLTGCIPD